MTKTVVGSFENYQEAQAVINQLVQRGFDRDSISLVAKQSQGENQDSATSVDTSDTGAGAAKGAAVGGALGGAAGLAIGIAGNVALPGIGAIVAAGPGVAALTGAGVGAVTGGLIGALSTIGVDKEDAHYYAESVRRGGALVIVKAEDVRAEEAADILENYGAVDIERRSAEWRQAGWTGFDENAAPYTGTASTSRTSQQTRAQQEEVVPVVEEQLAVGKRQVERGGVRVYTHLVEQPVQEQVQLREEQVNVERRPVNRPATPVEMQQAMKDRAFEVTERAEEAVVQKQAKVVEEVVVSKEANERTERINDTVRRTEVNVEKEPS